jgi:hypothetical protein
MFKTVLTLHGVILIAIGGWMQLTEPDYRNVRKLLRLDNNGVVATEKQPVPGALIAALFLSGGVLFVVGIVSEN